MRGRVSGLAWDLMSPLHSTSVRHDRQLQELLERKNWKQAINLCDKRLKRGGPVEEILVR
jgi:hypothetical protein